MSWLASLALYILHAIYAIANIATSWRESYFAREPHPLVAERSKLPGHVAIVLASDLDTVSDIFEQDILQNIEQVVEWCREVGIQRLTLYDRAGVISRLSFDLRARLLEGREGATICTSESELEYPLTPPLSDGSPSSSRSLSPKQVIPLKLHVSTLNLHESTAKRRSSGRNVVKRRVSRKTSESLVPPYTIHILSRESGKVAFAGIANSLAMEHDQSASGDFKLSINELSSLAEGDSGFPPPELMLIHYITPRRQPKTVLELFGFPPWQMSLTEFYYSIYPSPWWTRTLFITTTTDAYIPLREIDFRRALDQFSGAQMRLGK